MIDETGVLSYGELSGRAERFATALRDRFGVGPERGVAVMCRNHSGFVEAIVAGSRLGADLLLLGTDFPAAQLAKVLERERPAAVVHDEEFGPLFEESGFGGARVVAWHDGPVTGPSLDGLAAGTVGKLGRPAERGRLTILTSGTTGVPKSAPRSPASAATSWIASSRASSRIARSAIGSA